MPVLQKTVGIVIFPEVEVLDFCGPYEVFSVTRFSEENRRESRSPFRVLLVGKTLETIQTTGGMQVSPDVDFLSCPRLDILVVPGGWGTRTLMNDPEILNWIRQRAGEVATVTSVCTGSLLLGGSGVLDGKRATTHWKSLDLLKQAYPAIDVVRSEHVVRDGNIITSAGIAAGIDMALTVVKDHCGEEVARNTARYMEYPFPETNARRVKIA